MKVFRYLLIALVILVTLFLVAGLFAPKTQTITQSTIIKAPPHAIFQNIMYIDKVAFWHPYLKKDPNLTFSVGGKDGEVGAVRSWDSDVSLAGKGRDIITDLEMDRMIKSQIIMEEPSSSEATSTFILDELDNETKVTWTFEYQIPYPFNAFLLFDTKGESLKKRFAEGLAGLKNTLERFERVETKYIPTKMDFKGGNYIFKRQKVAWDDVQPFVDMTYPELIKLQNLAKLKRAGDPIGIYFGWDPNNNVDFALAIPVTTTVGLPEPFVMSLPPSKDCWATYVSNMSKNRLSAHETFKKELASQGQPILYPIIEEYKKVDLTSQSLDQATVRLIYKSK